MSDSVQPHRRQPTRLPRTWDSPGKNTGVGCHFLLQCMKVKSESEVAQSCLTLSDPMDCSLPGSSVHGIFQARVLEWGAIAFSKSWTQLSNSARCTFSYTQHHSKLLYSSQYPNRKNIEKTDDRCLGKQARRWSLDHWVHGQFGMCYHSHLTDE